MCLCLSCKEKYSEYLLIDIYHNNTDESIYVTLYPKAESNGLYSFGNGERTETEFYLDSKHGKTLYYSKDVNIEPSELAAQIFDSIYVSLSNKDDVIIKFTPNDVTGYVENIFSKNSTWEYSYMKAERDDGTRVKEHRFTFLILKDKIITK